MSVSPYLTDYKNGTEAVQAWVDGKDFILNDITSPYNGKPCSIRDFPGKTMEIRYKHNRNVVIYSP